MGWLWLKKVQCVNLDMLNDSKNRSYGDCQAKQELMYGDDWPVAPRSSGCAGLITAGSGILCGEIIRKINQPQRMSGEFLIAG
jgi:hypothetical protein